jgi:hypothetical protein
MVNFINCPQGYVMRPQRRVLQLQGPSCRLQNRRLCSHAWHCPDSAWEGGLAATCGALRCQCSAGEGGEDGRHSGHWGGKMPGRAYKRRGMRR